MKFIVQMGLWMAVLGVSTTAWSDALYLKNGNIVYGDILETNDQWTVVKTAINVLKYEADQIDRIEKEDKGDLMNASEEPLTDEKRQLIRKFLEVNGVQDMIQKQVDSVLAKAPAGRQMEFKGIFKVDAIIEVLIPVYAKTFSTKDLERMVNFFSSSAGQRYVKSGPVVLQETMQVIVDYLKNKIIK